ncbi:hypothetical protein Tco_1230210, partial [Tanacetum coccineum]
VLIAPEVGAAAVALPAGVLELDNHSSSEADPSESSLPLVSIVPMVSPFCGGAELLHDHHHLLLTLEIPTAPILPLPSTVVAPSTDIISPVEAPPRIRRRRAIII